MTSVGCTAYRVHMRGGSGRVAGTAVGMAAVLFLATACSGAEADTGPPVPTFPAATTSVPQAVVGDGKGVLGRDCGRILAVADLGALLGMPLDTVGVRTTIGVPAPAVGRIERIDCAYTGPASGSGGRAVLNLNGAVYTDAEAATKQWRTNARIEDGNRRELPIGVASAILVERPRETVLLVVYGSGTLTIVLPSESLSAGSLPGNRSGDEVLVDLALRLLPSLAAVGPKPLPVDPKGAAGAR